MVPVGALGPARQRERLPRTHRLLPAGLPRAALRCAHPIHPGHARDASSPSRTHCCPGYPAGLLPLQLALYLTGKLAITASFTVLFVFTAELFPTNARHSMIGVCSTIGRMGSTLAPQTPLLVSNVSERPPFGPVSVSHPATPSDTVPFPSAGGVLLGHAHSLVRAHERRRRIPGTSSARDPKQGPARQRDAGQGGRQVAPQAAPAVAAASAPALPRQPLSCQGHEPAAANLPLWRCHQLPITPSRCMSTTREEND